MTSKQETLIFYQGLFVFPTASIMEVTYTLKCVELKEFETLYDANQQVDKWQMEGFITTVEFDVDEKTYIAKRWKES